MRPRASRASRSSRTSPQPLYFRPYGGGKMLVGDGWPKQKEPVDPETYDDGTDDAHVERDGAAAHQPRCPRSRATLAQPSYGGAFVTGYSGVYDITEDWYPIVGEEEVGGYYSCFGGSGHCFKIGPAIGESLARPDRGQAAADRHLGPLRLALLRGPDVRLGLGAGEPRVTISAARPDHRSRSSATRSSRRRTRWC